jgi:serine/threonine protein kinase
MESNNMSFINLYFSTSTAAGTFHSMSPEMANLFLKGLNKEETDYQKDLITFESDLYSLGILAYELVVGKPINGYLDSSVTQE